MSLKTIKSKIRGIDKTHKVTKAMEAVSAVKMRKSQERALKGRPYAIAALSILGRVSASLDVVSHPFIEKRENKRMCLLLITSDKGLAGGLNSSVLKKAEMVIKESGLGMESVGVIAVGRKGYEYFSKRGYSILEYVENLDDAVKAEDLEAVTKKTIELFMQSSDTAYDHVVVVYNQFRSTFEQDAVARQLLPLNVDEISEVIKAIVPERGKYSDVNGHGAQELYTVEPDHETVLNKLLPYLLQIMIYHSLLEAKASEHSARMVAMKNASDKARDLSKELTLALNKARQAQITSELSEIVGGIEAMKV